MSHVVTPLTGLAIHAAIPALARLRVSVFREWPYLYDGTFDYESAYLQHYTMSPRAIIVAALDKEAIVGAATGMPLADHDAAFAAPFLARGMDIAKIFYCGESVLLPDYRGCGIGHAFFDQREEHARAHGFSHIVFCAVERPADHPSRPRNYRPLDAFWEKRGYARQPGMTANFSWKDIDQPAETDKPMQFWMRAL